MSLLVELDHAQHCSHDEEQEYWVQQDVLGDGDCASVCQDGDMKHKFKLLQQQDKYRLDFSIRRVIQHFSWGTRHLKYISQNEMITTRSLSTICQNVCMLQAVSFRSVPTKYEQSGSDESCSVRLRQLQHCEVGEDREEGTQHSTELWEKEEGQDTLALKTHVYIQTALLID